MTSNLSKFLDETMAAVTLGVGVGHQMCFFSPTTDCQTFLILLVLTVMCIIFGFLNING